MTKEDRINKLASRFDNKNQQVSYCFGYMDAEKEIIEKSWKYFELNFIVLGVGKESRDVIKELYIKSMES